MNAKSEMITHRNRTPLDAHLAVIADRNPHLLWSDKGAEDEDKKTYRKKNLDAPQTLLNRRRFVPINEPSTVVNKDIYH